MRSLHDVCRMPAVSSPHLGRRQGDGSRRDTYYLTLAPIMGTRYNHVMHVIKKKTLLQYCEENQDAREQLLAWHADAESSNWKEPIDIVMVYGNRVSIVGDNVVVFDIKGGTYRLVVRVEYKYGKVFIRWFGTHSEYDKIDVAKI